MRGRLRYLVVSAGAAIAMLSFAVCLELPLASAGVRMDPTAIDRTLKGDRQPLVPAPSVAPAQPRLPEGCESSFSAIRNPKAREVVGRCLAALPALAPTVVWPS